MGSKKRNAQAEAAAAAAVAAVAAAQGDEDGGEGLDLEAAELTDEVLEGLRRLDTGGNRILWRVYCDVPADGKREGFVEKLRTEQLDESRFKQKYGPGEYRVVGKGSDGHYIRGAHAVIKISDINEEPKTAAGGDAISLLREIRQADEARATKRAEDLKSYATILAVPLATLGAALIGRRPSLDVPALITALRPQQQSSLADLTAALANLQQLQGGERGGGGVDVVLKVLERLQDMPQMGGGSGDGWLGFLRDVIKEAAPHARELLSQVQNRQQPPPGSVLPHPPVALPPAPPPGPGNSTSPPPSVSAASPPSPPPPSALPADTDPMLLSVEPWLRRKAEDLHEWASNNVDPELCADMLLASVPKAFRQFVSAADLLGLLQATDWWERVTQFHPALAPYHAWVDDVRSLLMQMLQEEISEAAPGATPPATPERTQ